MKKFSLALAALVVLIPASFGHVGAVTNNLAYFLNHVSHTVHYTVTYTDYTQSEFDLPSGKALTLDPGTKKVLTASVDFHPIPSMYVDQVTGNTVNAHGDGSVLSPYDPDEVN
jgi:hypothetical protein